MRTAIQFRRFLQFCRYRILEKSPCNYYVVDTYRSHNYHNQRRIGKMQCFHQHICRYHTSSEVHRYNKKRHHNTARPESALRQHIGCRKSHRQIQQGSAYCINNCIFISYPKIRPLKYFAISIKINILWQQRYQPLIYHIRITERGNNNKIHGVQNNHQCGNCNHRCNDIKNSV